MTERVKITARKLPGSEGQDIDLTDCFDIQIGRGGAQQVRLTVRDGWVEVRVDGALHVQPVAANSIRFRPEHGLG